jgi:hypothetical protein
MHIHNNPALEVLLLAEAKQYTPFLKTGVPLESVLLTEISAKYVFLTALSFEYVSVTGFSFGYVFLVMPVWKRTSCLQVAKLRRYPEKLSLF